jgi:hypothetical protein
MELLDKVWGGLAVAESSLTTAIHQLRKAFGDDSLGKPTIRTLQRRGYRFSAPVHERPEGTNHPPRVIIDLPTRTSRPKTRGAHLCEGDLACDPNAVLDSLRSDFESVAAGRGRIALVERRRGVSQERLFEALASLSRPDAKMATASCHCRPGTPAYSPWIQILRGVLRETEPTAPGATQDPCMGGFLRICSDLRSCVCDAPFLSSIDSEWDHFALRDKIAMLLKTLAAESSLLLVLHDLQWADEPSLRMLEYLAREIRYSRILVVASHLELEPGVASHLSETLAEILAYGICGSYSIPERPLPSVENPRCQIPLSNSFYSPRRSGWMHPT